MMSEVVSGTRRCGRVRSPLAISRSMLVLPQSPLRRSLQVPRKGPAVSTAEAAPCLAKTHTPEVRALAPRAREALARVSDPSFSELAQLWAEGKPNGWAEHIAQLAKRLER